VILVEWFNSREDYDQIREFIGDSAELPATFDQWRESALESVEKYKKSGVIFRKIVVDAHEFTSWCQANAAGDYRIAIETFKVIQYRNGESPWQIGRKTRQRPQAIQVHSVAVGAAAVV
jgi:hypothetical protein